MKLSIKVLILLLTVTCSIPKQDGTNSMNTVSKPSVFKSVVDDVNTLQFDENQRVPLYTSIDFGKTWKPINTEIPKDANVSFIEPFEEELVVATDNYGVFISKNNRTKWMAISDNLPSKKINALHVNNNEIYVATYNSGLYFTKDNGLNWETINYNLGNLNSQSILMNDEKLLAGTDDGIYELEESTKKWTLLFPNVQVLTLFKNENRLVAGTNLGTLLSTDNGKSWNWIHQEGAVHYTKLIDTTIVEMYIHNDVFISNNWGNNWINADYKPRDGSYIYEVERVENAFVMSNNYGIFQSFDGGQTWDFGLKTGKILFFELFAVDAVLYGGTRQGNEYRWK